MILIDYKGKRYQAIINERGQLISKIGNVFLGRSLTDLVPGAVKVEDEVPADQE